jgi:Icc-related predicted phosphoesterase
VRIGRSKKNGASETRLRILFATDLHGSDVVFRKFLNAISVYEADVAILGGDLTGKRLAPVIETDDGYEVAVMGEALHPRSPEELAPILERIRNLGQYPIVVSADEVDRMQRDPDVVEQHFEQECRSQVADWMRRAAERLAPTGTPLYVTGGNDDYLSIEGVLDDAAWITNAEGHVLELTAGVPMISTGYGNPTPWHCPRDVSEDDLAERIRQMADTLGDPAHAVFNLHVPPFGSGLDHCPKLDTTLDPPRPVAGEQISAGSTAVVEAIRRYQPAISLHGHIHEAGGIRHVGRTICINPGSEYAEGILRCAVIDIDNGRISPQLLTA